jgi:hypothetical protein
MIHQVPCMFMHIRECVLQTIAHELAHNDAGCVEHNSTFASHMGMVASAFLTSFMQTFPMNDASSDAPQPKTVSQTPENVGVEGLSSDMQFEDHDEYEDNEVPVLDEGATADAVSACCAFPMPVTSAAKGVGSSECTNGSASVVCRRSPSPTLPDHFVGPQPGRPKPDDSPTAFRGTPIVRAVGRQDLCIPPNVRRGPTQPRPLQCHIANERRVVYSTMCCRRRPAGLGSTLFPFGQCVL